MTRLLRGLSIVALLCAASSPASAAVKEAAVDHLLVAHSVEVHADAKTTFHALGEIGHWWNSQHTYSGDAKNLTLDLKAGGCWCEQWADGSVIHGTVLFAKAPDTLRLSAPLGPLQAMGVNAILTFSLSSAGQGTKVDVTLLVNGSSTSGLDKLAPIVDGVLGEQVARLGQYVDGLLK